MTKLNNTPGLPKWPNIYFDEATGVFMVEGKHISFRRYSWVNVIFGMPAAVVFIFSCLMWISCLIFMEVGNNEVWFWRGLIAAAISGFILWNPALLTYCLFPKRTRVKFYQDKVKINWKSYPLPSGEEISFRACYHPLTDEKYEHLVQTKRKAGIYSSANYKLKFRQVEMVYGFSIVKVTTVANPQRAEQFALALQVAYSMSRKANVTQSPQQTVMPSHGSDQIPE